jgi:hypothetical protein
MSDASPDSVTDPSSDAAGDPFDEPGYREAIIDLLGGLAYGELTAFSRLAGDAELAPTLAGKAALARMAVTEFGHYERIERRLAELGVEAEDSMEPFVKVFDAFHERTTPSTWLEGLVKAYVGDGIASDFYREISAYVDPGTRELVLSVLEDLGHSDFAVNAVLEATAADPAVSGRLALWGRRLVGEALSQAQQVAAERDALTTMLVGGGTRPGADLAELARMFARLTDEHMNRMQRLGLTP